MANHKFTKLKVLKEFKVKNKFTKTTSKKFALLSLSFTLNIYIILTHFRPRFSFYTS